MSLGATFYIALWMSVSCTMILFNKAVLSVLNFPFPMFLTAWHMFFGTVLTQILSRYTDMLPGVKEGKIDADAIKTKILPVSLCFAISLVLSNKAYIYLAVSYIQMVKAFTPVAVLLCSFLLGLENPSMLELNLVLIISLGVSLTSVGESAFSMTGFIYQCLAIVAESGRLVLTNSVLKKFKLDSLSTFYYVAPPSMVLIAIACFIFEFQQLPYHMMMTFEFWAMMIANGCVAFGLNIASVLLIQHTSALVLSLAGIIKDILLVVLSMIIFRSPVTLIQYLAYMVTLLALNLHKEYKKGNLGNHSGQPAATETIKPAVAAADKALAEAEFLLKSGDKKSGGGQNV